ncbi:MAG: hypothetical protein A2Z75_02880, partial [Chloroflexi bacterium RBG_13_50_10]
MSLGVTIVLSILIIRHRGWVEEIAHWGYLGCFIINVVASGTLAMPGFGIVITFTLGGVLQPALVGIVAGIGETLGALSAYFMGYSGRGLFGGGNGSLCARFGEVVDRHGSKAVFLMASVCNPVYYPFAVFLGMLRFGLIGFLLATWA